MRAIVMDVEVLFGDEKLIVDGVVDEKTQKS